MSKAACDVTCRAGGIGQRIRGNRSGGGDGRGATGSSKSLVSHHPELQGLGKMTRRHVFGALEIGNGSGDLTDAIVPARA